MVGKEAPGLLASFMLACADPALDLPARPVESAVHFEPALAAGMLAPHFRARAQGVAGFEPWLVRGVVSDVHERSVFRGELPRVLRERSVPLRYWSEGDDLWLQPLAWLDGSETYTLVARNRGVLGSWSVATEAVRSTQLFPAPGRPVSRAQVLCADGLTLPEEPLQLSPAGTPMESHLVEVDGDACLAVTAESQLSETGVLPPSSAGVLLAPASFQPTRETTVPASCKHGREIEGACIEARDDRVLVTPLSQDMWWRLTAPEWTSVISIQGVTTTLVARLSANSLVLLAGTRLGSDGVERDFRVELQTLPPGPHLVVNEVMANPNGVEPGSEWIEIVNDSSRPFALAGLWLEDGTGRCDLPDMTLDPHEIALLVPADFRSSPLDPPILSGTKLVPLESLGARGLANSGEALLLVGPSGIVARFPSLAAVHAGRSWARRTLDSADDDPRAFEEHGEPGASPGAPNHFD